MIPNLKGRIYTRVSTGKQKEGESPEMQQKECEKKAIANDIDIVAIYKDDGISGSKTENRPDFLKCMKELQPGEVFMVYSISRATRSLKDLLDMVEDFEKRNIHLFSVKEKIDTSTPHGKFLLHLIGALAQLESDQTKVRTKDMMEFRKEKYGSANNKSHYGYSLKDGIETPIMEEQKIIEIIVSKRKEIDNTGTKPKEKPYAHIANDLNDRGFTTRKKGGKWFAQTVKNIIEYEKVRVQRKDPNKIVRGEDDKIRKELKFDK